MQPHHVEVTLRIPATWSRPQEMIERLPKDCRLTPDTLLMPDGAKFEINFRDVDDQFVSVFASMCRRPPTPSEQHEIENYKVQACLTGPGGSTESALALMNAAAVLIKAGGSGVFIDNSGVSFGGTQWCELAEDASSDAISFAFVGIIRGKLEAFTTGMQIMGLPDIQMRPADLGDDGSVIIEMIQYLCLKERVVGDGHIIANIHGPRFHVTEIPDDHVSATSPMHNPWGRLKLTSTREISESN